MNVFLVRTRKNLFHNEILTLYAFDFTIKHKSIDHKRRRTKSIRKAEKEKIMKQVILTGDRPTGRLHVGHYVGSLKRTSETAEFW